MRIQENRNLVEVIPPWKKHFFVTARSHIAPRYFLNGEGRDDGKCITKIIHKSHLLLTTSHLVRNEKYQGSLSYCTCSHSSPRDESVSFPDHLSHLDRTFLLLRLPRARRGHTGRPSGVGSADYGLEKTLVNTWLKGALESVFTKEVILTFH